MASSIERHERASVSLRPLRILDLGLIPYAEAWSAQNDMAARVGSGQTPETLLLLEHPHTYTCGRKGGRDHILVGEDELARAGVTVLDVDRGGDVTYHGPGQLVAYPIINLYAYGPVVDYHAYLRKLECALIDTLADFAITADRFPGYSGVWVGSSGGMEKIAAIGVRVDGRGITTHGIALNVAADLSYFAKIVPCGIEDMGVSSIEKLLGRAPAMQAVKQVFSRHFANVFGFQR